MNDQKKTILYLKLDALVPHPQNPRKELGDLTELADSIKAMGVMQNLTVIPEDEEWNTFKILIGHRRAAAAKLAGLEEVPCIVIEHMDEKEQLATMLLENIQRSDLTVIEQAEGFQLMLDIGASVAEVSQKTGFSETTVRHRVKLLELDRKLLEEKQNQMKIGDMMLLSKIKDPKKRETVLKIYGGDSNFAQRVDQAVEEEAKKEKQKQVTRILEEKGLESAEDTWKLDRKGEVNIYDFDENTEIPADAVYYSKHITWEGIIGIYGEKEENSQAKENAEAAERKKKVKDAEERYSALKELYKQMNKSMIDFMLSIKSFDDSQLQDIQKCAQMQMLTDYYFDIGDIFDFLCEKGVIRASRAEIEKAVADVDEADEAVYNAIEDMEANEVWIAILLVRFENGDHIRNNTWKGMVTYRDNRLYKNTTNLIISLGYKLSAEETQLLNGAHLLFDKVID